VQDFWQSHSSFPSSSDAQWRELIGKTLGESGFEKHLIHKSLDGISHQAIYPQSAQHQAPGQFPFRRGISSEPSNWIICQRYSIVDPPRANRQILEELEGGVNHIELNLAAGGGNKVINLQQIDATLAGVLLPLIQLSLAPGAHNLQPAALLLALAQHRC